MRRKHVQCVSFPVICKTDRLDIFRDRVMKDKREWVTIEFDTAVNTKTIAMMTFVGRISKEHVLPE